AALAPGPRDPTVLLRSAEFRKQKPRLGRGLSGLIKACPPSPWRALEQRRVARQFRAAQWREFLISASLPSRRGGMPSPPADAPASRGNPHTLLAGSPP